MLVIILICSCLSLESQSKQDYYWPFGIRTRPFQFDFNNKPFEPTNREGFNDFDQMNASICTKDGELLFYTNGCSIINKQHEAVSYTHLTLPTTPYV